jgi:hypothetical protein
MPKLFLHGPLAPFRSDIAWPLPANLAELTFDLDCSAIDLFPSISNGDESISPALARHRSAYAGYGVANENQRCNP